MAAPVEPTPSTPATATATAAPRAAEPPPESFWRRLKTSWRGGVAGALLAVLFGLALLFHVTGDGLIRLSYDLPFGLRRPIDPDGAVILYLDELSYSDLGLSPQAAISRTNHARLLYRLQADQARAVVFDVMFDKPSANPAEDAAFAKAIQFNRRVVLGAEFELRQGASSPIGLRLPIPRLRSGAVVGNAQFGVDSDGAVRRHMENFTDLSRTTTELKEFPNIAWAAATVAGAAVTKNPPKSSPERWLNYYGGEIPGKSYSQALYPDGVPSGFFSNKVVFIGQKLQTGGAGDVRDEFKTALSRWVGAGAFVPGVEIHATAYLNLVRRDWLTRLAPFMEATLATLVGLACGYGLQAFRRWWVVVGLALAVMAGITLLNWILFHFALIWFAWLIPVAVQVPIAASCAIVSNYLRTFIEKQTLTVQKKNLELQTENLQLEAENLGLEKQALELQTTNLELEKKALALQTKNLEQSLAYHLSPARVQQIKDHPELLKPGTERTYISILFSDIAVFSKVSESLEADDLVRLLNNYYEMALACVHDHDGTVIKLIGDAIFAIWNAPVGQTDHQVRTCRAALQLTEKLDEFGTTQRSMPLRTRVGLHAGPAHVGNIGSSTRFDYTAIGDSINLASRLEGLNKYLDTQILASREIQKSFGDTAYTRMVGYFRFRGLGRPVEVHELVGAKDAGREAHEWVEAFAGALSKFTVREFDVAEKAFKRAIDLRAKAEHQELISPEFRTKDGPSVFYLKQIEKFRTATPGPEWIGEINMDEK